MSKQILPSAQSALDLVEGKKGAVVGVTRDLVMRAALIGTGLLIVGEREPSDLVKKSIAGAGMIEVAVLLFAWMNKPKKD